MGTRIDFVENATTMEAGKYAVKYGWAFARGVCKDINTFAHKLPWVCVGLVAVVVVVISIVCVADARLERDRANKAMLKLQQQVETLSCMVEANAEH